VIDYTAYCQEDIASRCPMLLADLLGRRVDKMVRFSWYPPTESVADSPAGPASAFRFAPGPLVLWFEAGPAIGFGSLPEKASVTVWVEALPDGEHCAADSVTEDEELFPIDADDPQYSDATMAQVLGRTLKSIRVFTREAQNVLLARRPREAAIELEFDHGPTLVVAHGLHDDSDDMVVIERSQILPDLRDQLHEAHVFQDQGG